MMPGRPPMSFRLIVRLPGRRNIAGYSECALAGEAFTVYRRLARSSVRVEKILDLRAGHETPITGAELEAMAQRERCDRHEAAIGQGHGKSGARRP
jgi:hypothetical protein